MTDLVLVLTTAPDAEAETLARTLVEERLAACANVHAPMTSIYRWKGEIEREGERQIVVKTTRERLAALQKRLGELHSYDVPELIVVAVADVSEGYADWVRQSTA